MGDGTTPRTITIPEGDGDGVYRVGKLTKDARFLRIQQKAELGSFRRHTLSLEGKRVFVFVEV